MVAVPDHQSCSSPTLSVGGIGTRNETNLSASIDLEFDGGRSQSPHLCELRSNEKRPKPLPWVELDPLGELRRRNYILRGDSVL